MLPLCQINSVSVKPPLCVYSSDKLIINGGIYDNVLGSCICSFNYYLGYEGKGGHRVRKSFFFFFLYVKLQQQEITFIKTGNRNAMVYLKLSAFIVKLLES